MAWARAYSTPVRPASGKSSEPRGENWLFLTTGIAEETGKPVLETKTTVNSRSNLKRTAAKSGWVELRIVDWIRFERPNVPQGRNLMSLTDWATPDSQLLALFGA